VAVLVAAVIVSFAVAWATAVGGPGVGPHPFSATGIADMLLFFRDGQPPAQAFVFPGILYVVGAAIVGCVTGLFARRLKGTARRRALILVGLSPLGPLAIAAVMVAAPPLSDLGSLEVTKAVGFAALMTAMSLPFAAPFVLITAPIIAPPIILGHLLLEGWTRSADLPATGFARPTVRRAVLLLLVASLAAFTTFALVPPRG
jgi:hypothetical protein